MSNSKLLAAALFIALAAFGCEAEETEQPEEPQEIEQQSEGPDEFQDQFDEEPEEDKTGLDLPNMGEPTDGIITSAQPEEEDFEALADADVELVVSLRSDDEDGYWDGAETADDLGLEYVEIPVEAEEGLTEENAEALHEVLEDSEGDALVHCGTSDRAGALLALRGYWEVDMDADEALELGEAGGLDDLREAVAEVIAE